MAGPALDNRVVRFRDGFEPIDNAMHLRTVADHTFKAETLFQ